MNNNLTADQVGYVATVENAQDVEGNKELRVALIETLSEPKFYFMIVDDAGAFKAGDSVTFRLVVDHVTKADTVVKP